MTQSRCEACCDPVEELYIIYGHNAEVNKLCAECVQEYKDCNEIYHCHKCGSYIMDDTGNQTFCTWSCYRHHQTQAGQIELPLVWTKHVQTARSIVTFGQVGG